MESIAVSFLIRDTLLLESEQYPRLDLNPDLIGPPLVYSDQFTVLGCVLTLCCVEEVKINSILSRTHSPTYVAALHGQNGFTQYFLIWWSA